MSCGSCMQKMNNVSSNVGVIQEVKATNGTSGMALLIGAAVGIGLLVALSKK